MADDMERTEEATPRRREQSRNEGSAPRSADINTAAILLVFGPIVALLGDLLVTEVLVFCERMFLLRDSRDPIQGLISLFRLTWVIAVPVFVIAVVAFVAGFSQSRVWTLKPLEPKFERLNPFPNFKRVLPGKETGLELFKQVVKMSAVGGVVYGVVASATPSFAMLPSVSLGSGLSLIGEVLRALLLHAGVAFAVVACLDYFLAVRKFNEDAKMSKQEVRDERKQEDISPEVRQRRRRRMMELVQSAPAAVRGATVVVTNPTHYAVALKYESGVDPAPIVLAKGKDLVAAEMRREARRHSVPMVENPVLARSLFRDGQIGAAIPLELYRATAEVIAFVLQLRQRRYGRTGGRS